MLSIKIKLNVIYFIMAVIHFGKPNLGIIRQIYFVLLQMI